MSKSIDYYTKKTISSWDEVAPRHASTNATLFVDVADNRFNNLNPDFDALIDGYGVLHKSVVQVCCNNGVDLISIKNKGAGRCLGIDGSRAFVDQAIQLAQSSGHSGLEFCHSDIYRLPDLYRNSFDIAMITVGVFNWMPDLFKFMEICASLIKPGGVLLVEEIHPILGMYEQGEPSFIDASYFNTQPFKDTSGLDYFTNEKYEGKENFWFHHSLTDVFMAAIASNLQLEHIKELDYNIGNYCADLEFVENNPPLGINLAWRK
ncbi:bifunctional 2-polyprenyl-6-hydroxyphenol methylase/3-demethylubiquinol 3-O-methyltransferase UbiG [Motiliproteus sp. MSK22-1]|uniref:class I SAM-dependent methyltransferase n=1 Tax=Motiliproteus sp. MSK22-1 TaxID=1897630 RepID=UPI0009755437|nr:methyltransferase domain-containing protein [Motiliproteus sp. MSK22-1]OMH25735.1 methyltransferase type 11 [Motiliproteus sp. MSK22-1]